MKQTRITPVHKQPVIPKNKLFLKLKHFPYKNILTSVVYILIRPQKTLCVNKKSSFVLPLFTNLFPLTFIRLFLSWQSSSKNQPALIMDQCLYTSFDCPRCHSVSIITVLTSDILSKLKFPLWTMSNVRQCLDLICLSVSLHVFNSIYTSKLNLKKIFFAKKHHQRK